MRGRTTCVRSDSTRIAPVVNRHDGRVRCLGLNLGNPIGRPARRPARLALKLASARARASNPEE
jgi:hypothetical protein